MYKTDQNRRHTSNSFLYQVGGILENERKKKIDLLVRERQSLSLLHRFRVSIY